MFTYMHTYIHIYIYIHTHTHHTHTHTHVLYLYVDLFDHSFKQKLERDETDTNSRKSFFVSLQSPCTRARAFQNLLRNFCLYICAIVTSGAASSSHAKFKQTCRDSHICLCTHTHTHVCVCVCVCSYHGICACVCVRTYRDLTEEGGKTQHQD